MRTITTCVIRAKKSMSENKDKKIIQNVSFHIPQILKMTKFHQKPH